MRFFTKFIILGMISSTIVQTPAKAWDPQPTNPFPGVSFGAEIPGLSKTITCTDTPQIPDDCVRAGGGQVTCPAWSANDITPSLRPDGSWASLKSWCRNSWTPPTSVADDEDFRNRQNLAMAAATLESQNYNAAHPGEQKCVTWGPIVHANGISTSSGGVCANPVGTRPDGTTVQVPASPVGGSSSGSSSPSDSSTVSTNTNKPSVDLTQFGIGRPFTTVVSGRIALSNCPTGYQAAKNNLDGINSDGATECWPADAWAAYSVGGSAWSKFKGENITAEVQQAAVVSVELNKVKALALNKAQQQANLNIGKNVCVPWSFQNQSGQECAYIPVQFNPLNRETTTVASAANDTKTVAVLLITDSVTVDTQQKFSGNVAQIKDAVNSVVEDTSTAKAINSALQKVADLSKSTIKTTMKIPSDGVLESTIISKTPKICSVSSSKINGKKNGNCVIEYVVLDEDDNKFVLNTTIKVKR
jgi:hypothetical protein